MKNRPYHSEDITFCISTCSHTSCYRHKTQMRDRGRNHSVADLKDTYLCQFPTYAMTETTRRGRKQNDKRRKHY